MVEWKRSGSGCEGGDGRVGSGVDGQFSWRRPFFKVGDPSRGCGWTPPFGF